MTVDATALIRPRPLPRARSSSRPRAASPVERTFSRRNCGVFEAVGEDARNLPARVQGPTQSRAIHATGTARNQPAASDTSQLSDAFSVFKQCAVDVSGANDGQAASAENRRFAATIEQWGSVPA